MGKIVSRKKNALVYKPAILCFHSLPFSPQSIKCTTTKLNPAPVLLARALHVLARRAPPVNVARTK